MAIKLIGSYSKKLGLPAYSSHSFAASVETEIADLSQAQQEVARLYQLLQQAVDREIRHIGYVPGTNGNGDGNGQHPNPQSPTSAQRNGKIGWTCTDKQRRFILQLVKEHDLDINTVQETAFHLFGVGLRQLNRQQASDLISELLRSNSGSAPGQNGRRQSAHVPAEPAEG